MKFRVNKRYLWLPVTMKEPEVKLHMYLEKGWNSQEKIKEIDIHLAKDDPEFYAWIDLEQYLGQTIIVKCKAYDGHMMADRDIGIPFSMEEEQPPVCETNRPQIHFAPAFGWINDPNGLVYHQGIYHLYYQHNPYGYAWGNMHWGHAVSRDLLSFEELGDVREPDAYGTVYSGCAIQDEQNLRGFGNDALLFYYTAAGGQNDWSKEQGNLFAQRLMVSADGGKTLHDLQEVLPHIAGENRDPKIFWYAPEEHYVCVLYLEEYDFAVFTSKDLLRWEMTQKLTFPGMWECPDLFELPIIRENHMEDSRENRNEDHEEAVETRWIFTSADGYYVIGDFDGKIFTPCSEVQMAYATRLPYAAQSYAGLGKRVVSVPWLRMEGHAGNVCGQMGLPMELSLRQSGKGYKVAFTPVQTYEDRKKRGEVITARQLDDDRISFVPKNHACELEIEIPAEVLEEHWTCKAEQTCQTEQNCQAEQTCTKEEEETCEGTPISIAIGSTEIDLDFDAMEVKLVAGRQKPVDPARPDFLFQMHPGEALGLRMVIDCGCLEILAYDGTVYVAVELDKDVLDGEIVVKARNLSASCRCTYVS